MGRKATPTSLKLVRGNPGRRPIDENEPKPAKARVKPPRGLSKAAKKQWRLVAKQLSEANILTVLDTHMLLLYCEAYARWKEANEAIERYGMIVKTPKGYPMMSPYLAIGNKAFDQMKSIMTEFGMSPSSRTNVRTTDGGGERRSEWDE